MSDGIKCYQCLDKIAEYGSELFPFCSKSCKELWGGGRFPAKQKLTVTQMQEKLLEMGRRVSKRLKKSKREDITALVEEIFGSKSND